jgi:hypothetical protein
MSTRSRPIQNWSSGGGKPSSCKASRSNDSSGDSGPRIREVEDGAGLPDARPAAGSVEGRGDLGGLHEPLAQRGVGSHQRVAPVMARQIHQRAGHLGDRDAEPAADHVWAKRCAVDMGTRAATEPRRLGRREFRGIRYVERRQSVQDRGAAAAHDVIGSAQRGGRGLYGVPAPGELRGRASRRQVGANIDRCDRAVARPGPAFATHGGPHRRLPDAERRKLVPLHDESPSRCPPQHRVVGDLPTPPRLPFAARAGADRAAAGLGPVEDMLEVPVRIRQSAHGSPWWRRRPRSRPLSTAPSSPSRPS